jgi:dTDP-4-dehydrorhamnose reductase
MRVVLTGASGQLGSTLVAHLAGAGHEVWAWSGTEAGTRGAVSLRPFDLVDDEAVARGLTEADPEVVIHTAAVSSADAACRDPARARAVNTEATARLAAWCAAHDRRIVYTSTDLVFDGSKSWSREEDRAEPILAYGRTKLEGEPSVLAAPRGLVARISLMYGPSRSGRESYYERTIAGLRRGTPQTFFEDEYRTPLDLESASAILVRLAESDVRGVLHVAGPERVSRFELVRRQAIALGLDPALVRANRQADISFAEPRPVDVSLDTSRLRGLFPDLHLPTIEEAIAPRDSDG